MKNKPDQDIETTEHLFKEYYSLLLLVAFKILKDKQASKDVVQDFFVSYLQRKERIDIKTSFKSYAVRAVKNLSLIQIDKREKELSLIRQLDHSQHEMPKALEKAALDQKIRKLIDKLPESRRKIFTAFVFDGKSYSEIAKMHEISVNTVKTQMKRSYAFLRAEGTKDLWPFIVLLSIYLNG